MKAGMIAFTSKGMGLAERLKERLAAAGMETDAGRCRDGDLSGWTEKHFAEDDVLIFIGAAGIAVRAVAPVIRSKLSDPAVLVIDERGKFVIPMLSGHVGGANRIAVKLAGILDAIPVITTATDENGVFAIDAWASENQIAILHSCRIKRISGKLLDGENIRVKSLFPVEGKLPDGFVLGDEEYDVLITYKTEGKQNILRLVPPVLTLGVGCRSGVSAACLETAFERIMQKAGCHREAVCRVCTIGRKAEELGILEFCKKNRFPLQAFSAKELASLPGGFSSSEFVRTVTGVDNVCERSAVRGSDGKLLVEKNAGNGITMALAIAPYTIRFTEAE